MFYGILLIIWIISIVGIIYDIKKDKEDILLLSQLYNFVIGTFGWKIYDISNTFFLKYLHNNDSLIFSFCISVIIVLLLLIPVNIECKKKIKLNYIQYIIMSIGITLLGFENYVIILSNLGITN